MRRVFFLFFILLNGCSHISLINQEEKKEKFSDTFSLIETHIYQGRFSSAKEEIIKAEKERKTLKHKAYLDYLKGLLQFKQGRFIASKSYFLSSYKFFNKNNPVFHKILYHLIFLEFKSGDLRAVRDKIVELDPQHLSIQELEYYKKWQGYSKKKNLSGNLDLSALLNQYHDLSSYSELKESPYLQTLENKYSSLQKEQREELLYQAQNPYLKIYLKLLDLKGSMLEKKECRRDIRELEGFLEKNHSKSLLKEIVQSYRLKCNKDFPVKKNKIGVILPLSGGTKKFSEQVLKGFNAHGGDHFEIIVKDSSSGKIKEIIKNLVEEKKVSAIVGGLFSRDAKEQYMIARSYSVLFISLAEVYLSREEKDFWLIEIPASVESYWESFAKNRVKEKLGRKMAMLYVNSERSQAYAEGLWFYARELGLEIKAVSLSQKESEGIQQAVKKLLGLGFPKERKEEELLWKEIYLKEKKLKLAKNQPLRPIYNFDWVFMPTLPPQALQAIPMFSYYDAFSLQFLGPPSWKGPQLITSDLSVNNRIFFLGKPTSFEEDTFFKSYQEKYGEAPRLLTRRAYAAKEILRQVFTSSLKINHRQELRDRLLSLRKLKGLTGFWMRKKHHWIKDLILNKIEENEVISF